MSSAFRHRLRVRYSECDLQGVVFNAHYLAYIDLTMTELWREAIPGGYQAMVADGADMVVAEVGLRFRAPARFDDQIEVEASIARLGTTGMTTSVRIVREDAVLAEGDMRHVFVSVKDGAKRPIPDEVRAALKPYAAQRDDAVA